MDNIQENKVISEIESRMTYKVVTSANEKNLLAGLASFGAVTWIIASIPNTINVAGVHTGLGKLIVIPIMIPVILASLFGIVSIFTFIRRKEFKIHELNKDKDIDIETIKQIKNKYRIIRENKHKVMLVQANDFQAYADYNLLNSRKMDY